MRLLLLYGCTEPEHPHFSPDMLWRTGFRAPDPFWVVEKNGKVWVLVSRLEFGRAQKEAKADRVILHEGPIGAFLKSERISRVRIPRSFPHGLAEELKKYMNVELIGSGTEEVFPARARKTAWEIREIEKAARAVGGAIGVVRTMLKRARISARGGKVHYGSRVVSSELLREMIERSLFDAGYLASGTIASSGKDAAYPHAAGKGPVYARTPIVLDIFPRSKTTNYYADITRTLFKGAPSEPVRRMYRAVQDAQEGAIDHVRAGADAADLYKGVVDLFEKRGYPTSIGSALPPHQNGRKASGGKDGDARLVWGFIHGLGHGVGVEIHEAPRVGSASRILEAGNVITIEPGLYYPKGLSMVSGHSARLMASGIRIEDMVVVEKSRGRVIGKYRKNPDGRLFLNRLRFSAISVIIPSGKRPVTIMLAIKLQRVGKKHQPSYRLVVAEKRSKLIGPPIEDLGAYSTMTKQGSLKNDRISYWIGVGAQPTATVHNLLVKQGVLKAPKVAIKIKKVVADNANPANNANGTEMKTEVVDETKAEAKEETEVATEAVTEEKPAEEAKAE